MMVLLMTSAHSTGAATDLIRYEDFGAVGDGVTDDLQAIVAAHEYANETRATVVARADATYHLGRQALTAVITTDVNWNTAKFIIDDTAVEDHKKAMFVVRSELERIKVPVATLTRNQAKLAHYPEVPTYIYVEDNNQRRYIRRGLNQNSGKPQRDCFVLHPDGRIEGDIDWEYKQFSKIWAQPIDEEPLTISGGIFTTIANRMDQPTGYNYWARNIEIERSRTVIEGLTHLVTGEGEKGHPYRGFLSAKKCAYITFRDCVMTGHKTYRTIGSAGKPVSMGTYDLHANDIVDLRLIGVTMSNKITDRSRWGVIATNFCKGITLERCVLSRMDTHMGVSGHYIVKDCELGHMGLNAIGRGLLRVEGTVTRCDHFVNFRSDYGSTWDGDVEIFGCTWIPSGKPKSLYILKTSNDGTHDFVLVQRKLENIQAGEVNKMAC
jgi:hypothetical protein